MPSDGQPSHSELLQLEVTGRYVANYVNSQWQKWCTTVASLQIDTGYITLGSSSSAQHEKMMFLRDGGREEDLQPGFTIGEWGVGTAGALVACIKLLTAKTKGNREHLMQFSRHFWRHTLRELDWYICDRCPDARTVLPVHDKDGCVVRVVDGFIDLNEVFRFAPQLEKDQQESRAAIKPQAMK